MAANQLRHGGIRANKQRRKRVLDNSGDRQPTSEGVGHAFQAPRSTDADEVVLPPRDRCVTNQQGHRQGHRAGEASHFLDRVAVHTRQPFFRFDHRDVSEFLTMFPGELATTSAHAGASPHTNRDVGAATRLSAFSTTPPEAGSDVIPTGP